jgi:hypothetical protein
VFAGKQRRVLGDRGRCHDFLRVDRELRIVLLADLGFDVLCHTRSCYFNPRAGVRDGLIYLKGSTPDLDSGLAGDHNAFPADFAHGERGSRDGLIGKNGGCGSAGGEADDDGNGTHVENLGWKRAGCLV